MTNGMKDISKVLTAVSMTMLFFSLSSGKERRVPNSTPLPDLFISNAMITKDPTGKFIESITVTISNGCAAGAGSSYVLATFKESADPAAKSIYFVGHPLGPVRGDGSITQVINVRGKHIAASAFVLLEADPYHKVRESDEGNNSMTLNPKSTVAVGAGARCLG